VAARPWAHRLAPLVLAAAAVGAASGVVGAAASAIERDAATGPVVVVAVSLAAFVSVAVAEARTRRRASRRSA
jgi:manganese/zinc/iron transport system permease protein